ncbi:hypothetical protein ACFCW2_00060 [Qipengyuania sp. DSG2-2]|uniref:hypothetical protein n=1 Tax=Qipengyuania sp. DGS2-2 TaxID=3349631 RepID=UPI0036D2AE8A
MDADQPESLASFVARDWKLVRQEVTFASLFVILVTAVFSFLDLYFYELDSLYYLVGLVVWVVNYLLFVRLMERAGLLEDGQTTGIGTYFVLGLATGIPIILAGVFFILPGAYLLMRWLPAYGWAMTTFGGVSNAMHWSWEATSAHQALLSKALIGPVLLFIFAILIWAHYAFVYYVEWDYSFAYELVTSIAANVSDAVSRVWLTATSVTAFGLVSQNGGRSAPDINA